MLNWRIVSTEDRTSHVFCGQWKCMWKLLSLTLSHFSFLEIMWKNLIQMRFSASVFPEYFSQHQSWCVRLKNWSRTLFNELRVTVFTFLWKQELQSDVKNQIIKFIVWTELLMISITLVLREHQVRSRFVILNVAEKRIFRGAFCFVSYMKHWQFFKSGKCSKVINWTVQNHNIRFGKRRWGMNAFKSYFYISPQFWNLYCQLISYFQSFPHSQDSKTWLFFFFFNI